MDNQSGKALVSLVKYGFDPEDSDLHSALIGDEDSGTIVGSVPIVSKTNIDEIMDISKSPTSGDLFLQENDSTIDQDEEEIDTLEELSGAQQSDIYKFLKSHYGDSFIRWEPETLRVVLADDLNSTDIPDNVWETILAIKTAAVGVSWDNYIAFEKSSLAISGMPVDPGSIQYVSPKQMYRMYTFMKEIDPGQTFSDEVLRYIAARLFSDNLVYSIGAFPDDVQTHIESLGVSRDLVTKVSEKLHSFGDLSRDSIPSFIGELSENAVDIQIARYLDMIS